MKKPAIRKLVTLSLDTQRRVDDFRFGERIASQSEAMQRLIAMGLDAADRRHNTEGTKE